MKKRKKRRAKRILGNDRGLMMICKDIRRRWCQYGENRKQIGVGALACHMCSTVWIKGFQVDHIKPLGPRPRMWSELGPYAEKMFERKCQLLCKSCHKIKTDTERERRQKK